MYSCTLRKVRKIKRSKCCMQIADFLKRVILLLSHKEIHSLLLSLLLHYSTFLLQKILHMCSTKWPLENQNFSFFYFFLPANVLPTNRSNLNQLLLLSCNLSHHNLYKSLEPSLKFQLFFVLFFLKPTTYSLLSKAFKRTHPYPSLILSNTITQRLITQKWLSNSTLNDHIADL